MNKKSILKGLASYDKLIKEHEEKILMEAKKENPKIEVLDYWKKEIEGFKNNRKRLADKL
ncbi:MAG: hypothetical protein AABX93_03385 [Nanoarchaeota archaeon]